MEGAFSARSQFCARLPSLPSGLSPEASAQNPGPSALHVWLPASSPAVCTTERVKVSDPPALSTPCPCTPYAHFLGPPWDPHITWESWKSSVHPPRLNSRTASRVNAPVPQAGRVSSSNFTAVVATPLNSVSWNQRFGSYLLFAEICFLSVSLLCP